MFMFDIESLGIESTTIILSAAITYFDFNEAELPSGKERYNTLVGRSHFVKFNAKEQGDKYKRSVTQSTLDWWMKQSLIARDLAIKPSKADMNAAEGIESIRAYINANGGNNQIFWARGSLDQMAIDSLCRVVGCEPLAMYNVWRDVRTAVDLIADTNNGYCAIKDFNPDIHVMKHDPRNDCALDIMMLLHHK